MLKSQRSRVLVSSVVAAIGGSLLSVEASVAQVGDLQAQVDATPDGGVLTLSGVHVTDGIILEGRNGLTIVGDSTAVVRQPANIQDKIIRIVGGSDITLRNLEIAGSRNAGDRGETSGSGVSVKGTDGVTLDNLFVHDTWGDFVDLDRGVKGDADLTTRDVTITGSRLERSGRQGISVSRFVANLDVVGNTIVRAKRTAFDIEHAIVITDVVLEGNVIQDFGTNGVTIGRGGTVRDVVIQDNTVATLGQGGWVDVLERDPANQVQGLTVCDNVAAVGLYPNNLLGAAGISTNEPHVADDPVSGCS